MILDGDEDADALHILALVALQKSDPRQGLTACPARSPGLEQVTRTLLVCQTELAGLLASARGVDAAGAMARPTSLLLCASSDWRWLLDRPHSPWYPTMRLFRQRVALDWSDVVASAATEIGNLAAASRGNS